MANNLTFLFYAAPLVLIFLVMARKRRTFEHRSGEILFDAIESGMNQPPSLHPVIDPTRCIGCASCVHACPEFPAHQVLGIVRQRAELVSPTDCIGHGECLNVCPEDAIRLVFGTAERGVDIPHVSADFSTNVDGIYIAGELGGMGLIRNAIAQGSQAMAQIAARSAKRKKAEIDVIIIGAGPAGIAASLGAIEHGLSYLTIERERLGGTVANFPTGKLVMTAPGTLPMVGDFHFREVSKEHLVTFWQETCEEHNVKINDQETLVSVKQADTGHLIVTTDRDTYSAGAVLLAIGRRGTPRKLDIPGEELAKVAYGFRDAIEYTDQDVVVVGGGDSAVEAACAISEVSPGRVTLCYRGDAFGRVKKKNRERMTQAAEDGAIDIRLKTQLTCIEAGYVHWQEDGNPAKVINDRVVICAGGILPTGLLREIGIEVETKYGQA